MLLRTMQQNQPIDIEINTVYCNLTEESNLTEPSSILLLPPPSSSLVLSSNGFNNSPLSSIMTHSTSVMDPPHFCWRVELEGGRMGIIIAGYFYLTDNAGVMWSGCLLIVDTRLYY
jgi:hypothetical protein